MAPMMRVWGVFYRGLCSLFCIWGAISLLTSPPFDAWWHNAYGMDVAILSPPHTLLAMGMIFLQFGACVSICKYLNNDPTATGDSAVRPGEDRSLLLRLLFIICASSLLTMVYGLGTDYLRVRGMRNSLFYIIA